MASTTKKDSKKSKAKPRTPVLKKSQPKQNIQSLQRALDESLEREAATRDILRMIARSPADVQSVMDTIAENAAKLCDAADALVWRVEDNFQRVVAHFGPLPISFAQFEGHAIDRRTPSARAIVDRQTIHVYDLQAVKADFPLSRGIAAGTRTVLVTPLLREGIAIGAIHIRRREVRPFSDSQIELLETFADQAVIAIENARLIHEQQARNRDLTEALEQQTATSEILRIISSSLTDAQPVFDTIVRNAAQLCEGSGCSVVRFDGELLHLVAQHNVEAEARDAMQRMFPRQPTRELALERAVLDSAVIHVPDAYRDVEQRRDLAVLTGVGAILAAPLLRDGHPIGAIGVTRSRTGPFTEKQIALLKTFADQAVIAIENVRLFKEIQERNAELREALEHQTATAEVLGIISRSPTDVQPVLDAIVESATRVCGIDDVLLQLRDGNNMILRAHFGPILPGRVEISIDEPQYHWMREHGPLHIPDVRVQNDFPMMGSLGNFRTILGAPLRQQEELIGGLFARRTEVRPFTPAQIKLLETFADQAVIAIENVRLFNELKEALEQQTATSEILRVIASSPTDIQPVLDAVAESAARLCESSDAHIWRRESDRLLLVAHHVPSPEAPSGSPPSRSSAELSPVDLC